MTRQDDGATLRDHLNSLWRQSGVKPQQLEEAVDLHPLGAHVWICFAELNNERGSNGITADRITARQMIDWCWATGSTLELWERRAIRAIDAAWATDD